MKNKVLLVYPGGFGSIFPELPMALLYLGWALKKKNYEVEILDARIRDYMEIKDKDYLFVGISSLTGSMINQGLKIAKHIRSLNKNIPIVWGGIHVSLLPEQSLNSPFVDIVVRGEGELTIQALAGQLQNNGDLSIIKGISYKVGDKVISNPDREFMNLDDIDIELPYELFDMSKYSLVSFPMHTSRGCPYRCGFCYNTVFNKRKWRNKGAKRVLDEMEYVIKKFGCKAMTFVWEDEFFIDVKRVKEICEGILSRGIKIKWDAFCRFNSFRQVDEEMLKLLEKSGCCSLTFGGESGSQRILDEVIQKDIKVEDMVETTERLSKTNIREVISFISGIPTETDEDMKKTFALIDKLKAINPRNIYFNGIFLYTPYPGTRMYDLIIKDYGFKPPKSLEEWADYGIYRNVGATWHPKKYIKKYKMISILTRFPFYKEKFTFKDFRILAAGERISKFPLNMVYWTLANLAIFRWKHKFFKFPIELMLLEKALEKMRGFV